MTQDEFKIWITGSQIERIETQERSNGGAPPDTNEAFVVSFVLNNGVTLKFDSDGSGYCSCRVVPNTQ